MAHEVELNDSVFEQIKEHCLEFHREGNRNIFEMQQLIMDMPEIPMHYPYHHFIVPAVLLTAADVCAGKSAEELSAELDTACERSKNVLGGFCGFYGACGAAVGVGIFFSIFTGTTPVAEGTWADCNRATADALHRISEIAGPRCCKRCSFQALYSAAESARNDLGLEFEVEPEVKCHYSSRNLDCKGSDCPFFAGEIQGD